jgi:hypothetical protein
VAALPEVNDPHAASILAFVSRSTSAYTLVVSIETCPNHALQAGLVSHAFEHQLRGLTRDGPPVAIGQKRRVGPARPRGLLSAMADERIDQ